MSTSLHDTTVARTASAGPRSGDFDAIFVGSGINSLVGAALLAKRGWRVAVLERSDRFGGAVYTVTTDAGFTADLISTGWLLFMGSPGYQDLREDLERHGLRFANTDQPWAAVRDDGTSLVMTTDRARNVERMERLRPGEGVAWENAMNAVFENAGDLLNVQRVYPWSPAGLRWAAGLYRRRGAAGARALVSDLVMSARAWVTAEFRDPMVHALIAPWSLHGNNGPDKPGTALMVRASTAFAEQYGNPMPVGGGKEVVNALVAIVEEHGGSCLTGVDVDRVVVDGKKATGVAAGNSTFRAARAVACCVTPPQLYGRLLDESLVPKEIAEAVGRWRAGSGVFQLMFTMKRKLDWSTEDDLGRVAVTHISNGLDAVSKSANEAVRGLLPVEPTLCVAQPMALDPTRGPDGAWQFYISVGDIPETLQGDAAGEIDASEGWTEAVREAFADRVQQRLARLVPGLEENILERIALSPADLEAADINLVGGSASSGTAEIDQLLAGSPTPYAPSPGTPVKNLYHIGASTHPGPGLGGNSGYLLSEKLGGRVRRLAGAGRRRARA